MKIIKIEQNPKQTNNSPYIYKVTFKGINGEHKSGYCKQSHLDMWLKELNQIHDYSEYYQGILQHDKPSTLSKP
jgi:hypothetical protein